MSTPIPKSSLWATLLIAHLYVVLSLLCHVNLSCSFRFTVPITCTLPCLLLCPGFSHILGSSLAIEDAFAVGHLFTHITQKSQIPSFLCAFNEIRIPRSKMVSNSELSGLMFTSLPPGEHRALRNFGLRYSLVIANTPEEHTEEVAQMWMSWIALVNYDARDSVEEWWLIWGRHLSEMKVNNTQ